MMLVTEPLIRQPGDHFVANHEDRQVAQRALCVPLMLAPRGVALSNDLIYRHRIFAVRDHVLVVHVCGGKAV